MPTYFVNGMHVHMKIAGKAPQPCRVIVERNGMRCYCQGIGEILCDWPTGDEASGSAHETCDMPLCKEHGIEVGKNRHYCPKHKAAADAAAPELFP